MLPKRNILERQRGSLKLDTITTRNLSDIPYFLLVEGAYFKVREMGNIKCKNLFIVLSQNKNFNIIFHYHNEI